MKVSEIINRTIKCSCGSEHRCDIEDLYIGRDALNKLGDAVAKYNKILIISDKNTDAICGDRVRDMLGKKLGGNCVFKTDDILIPDELAVAEVQKYMSDDIDFVIGIGSGVINDICKYISFENGIKCGIIATATSMDGYASSGAAMIFDNMKITFTTHAPSMILGDTDILKDAPMDMIRSGYADIIGKYSSLNDWKLGALINGEPLCQFIYGIVKESTDEVRDLAGELTKRNPEAIGTLMEILVLVGVCFTLCKSTRPGSGSEHHLSHYFEITGLIDNKPYFFHGTDVGYSMIATATLREKICAVTKPAFKTYDDAFRMDEYKRIYKDSWKEVWDLQEKCGWYKKDLQSVYIEKWDEICKVLSECPTAQSCVKMLETVGLETDEFEKMYGLEKIKDGIKWGKDLKDRYTVLWLYSMLDFEK